MREMPVRFWPFVLVYLATLIAAVAVLHMRGRGWIGAIISGLILAGILVTLIMLLASYRRR